ncbi:type IV pilus modification protein PilV [Marinobacter zhejiangensis]|uniref:Type IV pilus assembly protein PilV n=1 Tax=Marinobacter zhejiangensis TaxID=488535 RepID=A0A1I4S871_9GAMM|nr:type IV pilus modification protein PilV [Marinobacter zhejiangensis]SFM60490.1 type IV pilus assembly protein PilV [Marinobacter zhejiangensis]
MKKSLGKRAGNDQAGFSLIELLVTLVILAVGLLGLAGLMMDGLRNNQSAYLRTQASILAYDMADRIRLNRGQARVGMYSGYSTAGNGAITSLPTCVTAATGCTAADRVTLDKAEWTREIQGIGNGSALLPSGVGTIGADSSGNITVSVSWQETQWDEAAGAKALVTQQFDVVFRI